MTKPGNTDGMPKALVFDLDGTLYTSRESLERHLVPAIHSVVGCEIGLTGAELQDRINAWAYADGYFLKGFEKETDISIETALEKIYSRLNYDFVQPRRGLAEVVSELSSHLDLYVLTNSSKDHAERVLEICGLSEFFDRPKIYSISELNYNLKPSMLAFNEFRKQVNFVKDQFWFFDDSVRNLHEAWRQRFVPVLVSNEMSNSYYETSLQIEHTVPHYCRAGGNLVEFLHEQLMI